MWDVRGHRDVFLSVIGSKGSKWVGEGHNFFVFVLISFLVWSQLLCVGRQPFRSIPPGTLCRVFCNEGKLLCIILIFYLNQCKLCCTASSAPQLWG